MSLTIRSYMVLAAVVALAGTPRHAFSQAIVGGQTALDNAAGAGARSPGNMVSAGVGQVLDFQDRAAAGTIIDEPAPTTSPRAELIADSLQTLFDQLNQAIVLFHNLLRARAGLPPTVPASLAGNAGSLNSTRAHSKESRASTAPGRLASYDRVLAPSRTTEQKLESRTGLTAR